MSSAVPAFPFLFTFPFPFCLVLSLTCVLSFPFQTRSFHTSSHFPIFSPIPIFLSIPDSFISHLIPFSYFLLLFPFSLFHSPFIHTSSNFSSPFLNHLQISSLVTPPISTLSSTTYSPIPYSGLLFHLHSVRIFHLSSYSRPSHILLHFHIHILVLSFPSAHQHLSSSPPCSSAPSRAPITLPHHDHTHHVQLSLRPASSSAISLTHAAVPSKSIS